MLTDHLKEEATPSVSPDNPTRQIEESFNDATCNSQGAQSHIYLNIRKEKTGFTMNGILEAGGA